MEEQFAKAAVRLTGRTQEFDLPGALIMVDKDGQPLLHTLGQGYLMLMVFSTVEKLRAFMTATKKTEGVDFEIKQIVHGGEFMQSIPPEIKLVADAVMNESGKVRFFELQRGGSG